MGLEERVVVVTGASRGIGQAAAVALARAGADVVVAARTLEESGRLPGTAAATVAEITALGRQGLAVRCDVGRQEDLDELVRQTVERFGHVDVLVNNAAYVGAASMKGTRDLTRADWERMFAVNVHGPFMLIKGFLPHFPPSGGVVINVTSASAEHRPVMRGAGGWSPGYGATKAALNRLGNQLAAELLEDRIAVITLDPCNVFSATMAALGDKRPDQVTVDVPAQSIVHLASSPDAMAYSGKIIRSNELVATMNLPGDLPRGW